MTDAETNRGKIARLMAILSGDAPIESGVALFVPDVLFHVDGWRFQGINVWANWIQYTRTRGRVQSRFHRAQSRSRRRAPSDR